VKKGGTDKPQNPDIAFDAEVRMRELRFERAPEPEIYFRGNTRRNSVWGSRRENLPDEVREGVVYRNAGVRLRIASEIVNSNPDVWNGSDKGSDKERTQTNLGHSRRMTGEQEPESEEEKK
jgi:hypothetical protein